MNQRPQDAFAIVGLGCRLAIRHWWRLLSVMVPVLVLARLAYLWFEAGTGVAIVNGRVLAGEPAPNAFRIDLSGPSSEFHLAASPALSLGWLLAVLLAVPIVSGVATAAPPVTARACWRRLGSRLPALSALAVLLVIGVLALASVAGLVGASLDSPLFAAAAGAAGAPLMAPLALAVPAVLVEGLSLAAALRRGVEVTRSRLWSIGFALLLGLGVMPGAVLWVAGTIDRADVSVGGPATNAVLAGLCAALASILTLAIAPLQPAVLALMFVWACDRPTAVDAVDHPVKQADWPMAEPARVNGAVMVALAATALLPPAMHTGQVLWNPGTLPVLVEEPYDIAEEPIAATTLTDGRPALVTSMHVAQCTDARCSGVSYVSMPCIDGAEPHAVGDDTRSCSIEAPLSAATLRQDGTLAGVRLLPPNGLRLLHCQVTDVQQCEWGGATTILDAPGEQQFLQAAMADVPGGGVVVAVMRTERDSDRGEVTLVHCADLGCSEPRIHRVGTVPAPAGHSGGPIAVAVEPSTSLVAVSYRDQLNGDLWLGGCSTVECEDAALTRIERSPAPPDPGLDGTFLGNPFDGAGADAARGNLIVDATVAGPIALEHTNADWVDVVTCAHPACVDYHASTIPATSARLMRSGSGGLVLVAATPGGVALDRLDAPDTLPVRLPAAAGTDVLAATAGPDGRPHLVLRDSTGTRLITCANPHCRG